MTTKNFEKIIEELNEKEREKWRKTLDVFSKYSDQEKNEFFIAHMFLTSMIAARVADLFEKIINTLADIDKKKLNKEIKEEIKEIEGTISLGIPGWVKYTRKTKKTKK